MSRFVCRRVVIFRQPATAPELREHVFREGEFEAMLAEIRSSYPQPRVKPPASRPGRWWSFWKRP